MRALVFFVIFAGCVDPAQNSTEPTDQNLLQGDDKSDGDAPLWAGLTSATLTRYAPDPCNNGMYALGDDPIHYDEYVRERAGIRNICFEVWSPGVTDWDNPDFWKQLDVQVHYRFGTGELHQAYVNSIDRRGNNRRYAWTIDYSLDPMVYVSSVASIKVPFQIVSENETYVTVSADLEVYFTVNGRMLSSPSHHPFVVRYEGYARKPVLAPNDNGYVLHDIVNCNGARFGSGAGFFAADIRDSAAIANLGAGLDGSMIYAVPTARSAANMSFTYGSQTTIAGQALPGFSDYAGLTIAPDGTTMRVEISAYDRSLGKVRTLVQTFNGCASAPAN